MSTRRMNGDTLEICSGDAVVISINEKMEDGVMDIAVAGELRNEVAHDFEDELMAAFSICSKVTVDLKSVSYIASTAMRALLSVQQIIDENPELSMLITALSTEVRETFVESGFIDILNIQE